MENDKEEGHKVTGLFIWPEVVKSGYSRVYNKLKLVVNNFHKTAINSA